MCSKATFIGLISFLKGEPIEDGISYNRCQFSYVLFVNTDESMLFKINKIIICVNGIDCTDLLNLTFKCHICVAKKHTQICEFEELYYFHFSVALFAI